MAAGFPLKINGLDIRTSEALYQACRFPTRPDVQREIIKQKSPMAAKMKSKPYRRSENRSDWDQVRIRIMRWCLRVKLAQNWNKFSKLLLDTDPLDIVELSYKDDFWGAKPMKDEALLVGTNALGRLLMKLRDRIKNEPQHVLLRVAPLEIENFQLDGEPIQMIDMAINTGHRSSVGGPHERRVVIKSNPASSQQKLFDSPT